MVPDPPFGQSSARSVNCEEVKGRNVNDDQQ
jgi:hypothetical protein